MPIFPRQLPGGGLSGAHVLLRDALARGFQTCRILSLRFEASGLGVSGSSFFDLGVKVQFQDFRRSHLPNGKCPRYTSQREKCWFSDAVLQACQETPSNCSHYVLLEQILFDRPETGCGHIPVHRL